MKHVLTAIPFALFLSVTVACGGDDEPAVDGNGSSGQPTSSSGGSDNGSSSGGSSGGASSSSSGGASSSSSGAVPFECEDTPFVFPADTSTPLAATTYDELFTVNAAFPFDVVGLYDLPTGVDAAGAIWGEHGGALSVVNDDGDIVVHRLTAPATATGALTDDVITLTKPAELFGAAQSFINYPPVASLPNGQYVLTYTSPMVDSVVPGLGFLYSGNTLEQRAWANGVFNQIGFVRGDTTRVLGHAFSPFAETQPATNVGALYVTDVQGKRLAGGTTTGFALFTTGTDSSGPVVKDGNGNVVLATSGSTVNVRGVSRCAALEATGTIDRAAFHAFESSGSASLAAIPAAEGLPGYVVNVSYDTPAEVLAVAFTRTGDVFAASGAELAAPLSAGSEASALGVFADDKGYLWVGVDTDDGGHLAKLRRRAN